MTHEPQTFAAPDGTEMVILPAVEYARLKLLAEEGADLTAAQEALARIEAGEGTMPGEVLDLILDEDIHPIAAWRRHRGLSQAQLAEKAGLSQVWISRIEQGGGYGSRATRRRLAVALGAPIWAFDEAEGGSETPKPVVRRRGKYTTLRERLQSSGRETVAMTFQQLDELIGGLPRSAVDHRAWWANHEGNLQAKGWLGAGYVAEPEVARRRVMFRKRR
jgi:transcriptional regulator with XRE-family HTH domain